MYVSVILFFIKIAGHFHINILRITKMKFNKNREGNKFFLITS